jgi:hypothetical protein
MFFGPHMDVLYGKYDADKPPLIVRLLPGPASNSEGICGVLSALDTE